MIRIGEGPLGFGTCFLSGLDVEIQVLSSLSSCLFTNYNFGAVWWAPSTIPITCGCAHLMEISFLLTNNNNTASLSG